MLVVKKVNFDFCYYFIETCQNISCSLPIEGFVESFYVFREAIPDKMLQTWSLSWSLYVHVLESSLIPWRCKGIASIGFAIAYHLLESRNQTNKWMLSASTTTFKLHVKKNSLIEVILLTHQDDLWMRRTRGYYSDYSERDKLLWNCKGYQNMVRFFPQS